MHFSSPNPFSTEGDQGFGAFWKDCAGILLVNKLDKIAGLGRFAFNLFGKGDFLLDLGNLDLANFCFFALIDDFARLGVLDRFTQGDDR